MSYPLTSVVEQILKNSYVGERNVEVSAGNFAEGDACWDNKSSSAIKRFVVFSYLRDFKFLWGLHRDGGLKETVEKVITANYKINPRAGAQEPFIANELTLVIVWDGMPTSDGTPMNVGRYVTPFDWVMMFSYSLFKLAMESKKKPRVRIFILDLMSQEYSGSFGVKTLNMLHSQFPWIQIYRPVGEQEKYEQIAIWGDDANTRAILPISFFGFENFISDFQKLDNTLSTFNEMDGVRRLDYLETAIQLWATNLAKPGDRHTIANLVGPLILANGFKTENRRNQIIKKITDASLLRSALGQLVFATGLASPENKQGGEPPTLLQASNKGRLGRRQGLKFILIDDQYSSGFHHILSAILFGDAYSPPTNSSKDEEEWSYSVPDYGGIKCYSKATDLLKILSQSKPITDWVMPRKLSLPDEGDILILDLRLWLEDSEKKDFFDALKKICTHLEVVTLCEKDSSFKAAYDVVCGNVENETAALVLLPLLLSHFDSSLPIVLFSSTHQRAVIEMVAHRPNIITDFSKPLLGNYAHLSEAGNYLNELGDALEKAIQMHEARIIWERIIILESKVPSFFIGPNSMRRLFNRGNARDYPLDNANIKKQLGYYFQHYILRAAYFDFVSIPWEFIEGGLKIDEDSRFDVIDIDNMGGFPENGGGLLLKHLRHKKAHGGLTALLNTMHLDQDNWRCFAILEFLVFIDFLEQAGGRVTSPCGRPINVYAAKDADVGGNILRYSTDLICAIWGQVDQSFSQTTKNVTQALLT